MGLLSRLGIGPKKWAAEQFWSWVQSDEGQGIIQGITGSNQTAIGRSAASLGDALKRVNPGFSWGIRKSGDNGSLQLEIGAGGLSPLIPSVEAFVATAPQIPGLQVVAFKQPLVDYKLEVAGQNIGAEDVSVIAEANGQGKFDMQVFVGLPRELPQDVVNEIGFILLDHIFGELLVMKYLGGLKFTASDPLPEGSTPILEFAKILNVREEAAKAS